MNTIAELTKKIKGVNETKIEQENELNDIKKSFANINTNYESTIKENNSMKEHIASYENLKSKYVIAEEKLHISETNIEISQKKIKQLEEEKDKYLKYY